MNPIAQIEPSELRERVERGEAPLMIDVREPEEVAQGMIPGAVHIPLGQLAGRLDELDPDRETVFICRSGYRSERACEYLEQSGFDKVVNMSGGMLAWNEE
ncbi:MULTISPECIES: rhodanese-like domain-containing protein [Saccharibacillus]|uniref:Rhodanese-like domain-containing protein n=1 Tax=Saccharibacillus brassicae TaxID=2583377 RepID=A0A4Y6URU0_SACBS|nr:MULTISPECIES: rhodanese-like domain-containing protein [Saccharibacillus]MWJ32138.1 rhodanese-like domain-containing protein [Saccharibacillus sp. WB 17]QDH19764.1 rhodanese-like domain-containing protein [Saccharibacillus brassicae]